MQYPTTDMKTLATDTGDPLNSVNQAHRPMKYTVSTKTGTDLVSNGTEIEAIKAVSGHAAPDVLNVFYGGEKTDGASFLRRYDNSEAISELRGEWPGDETAEELLDALD